MQRAAREYARSLRQHRRWLEHMRARGLTVAALAPNRFRKQLRTGGCGHARCWLCHGDKLAQRPTPRLLRALAAGRDGLAQLEGSLPT